MAIPTKDIKILWSRAAGRCSMPDCRTKLTADATPAADVAGVVIGETCHIVARKPNGPRGNSVLSEDDRDHYSNLILLCSNHHIVIDQDTEAWPIELLHKTKTNHELWVEENLSHSQDTQSNERYMALVNQATEKLSLCSWDRICDHAVRGFLYDEFVEGLTQFETTVFRCVWPQEKPQLEEAIINLAQRVSAFVRHFLARAKPLEGKGIWAEDKDWKKTILPQNKYHHHQAQSIHWQKKSMDHLSNVVVALNHFADSVRANLISDYFIIQGKFTLFDSLGVTNEMTTVRYIPSEYIAFDNN